MEASHRRSPWSAREWGGQDACPLSVLTWEVPQASCGGGARGAAAPPRGSEACGRVRGLSSRSTWLGQLSAQVQALGQAVSSKQGYGLVPWGTQVLRGGGGG